MSSNGRFVQYRGKLSLASIAEGMNVVLANAKRLHKDAETLMAAGRLPTATALAILSIEEAGKIAMLRGLLLAETQSDLKTAGKQYRSHTSKNVLWMLGNLIASGARTMEDLVPMVDPAKRTADAVESLKQLCLYTDCVGEMKWTQPNNLDLKELAPYSIGMAQICANTTETTEADLALWQKHMREAKMTGKFATVEATRVWYEDAVKQGLIARNDDTDALFGVKQKE